MAAAAVVHFEILTVGRVKRVKLRHRAKFRGDRSNLCGDMAIFQGSGCRRLGF